MSTDAFASSFTPFHSQLMTIGKFCRLVTAFLASTLSACAVGPDYVRPTMPVASEFKELKGWKQARPQDERMPVDWWSLFNESTLSQLLNQVAASNQSIAQAEAQYRQAQHLVQSSESSLLPVASLTGTVNRFKAATGQSVAVAGIRNLFGQAANFAWELDLWGKVRRQIEANTDNAQASAATLHGLILSSQAQLAQNYFQLRTLDSEKAILDEALAAYEKVLKITRNRYAVGVAAKADVVQAEAQLYSVQTQATDLGVQRAKLEHAIAVLIGKTPAELDLPLGKLEIQPPAIPAELPSQLLERRPDIAAAERKVAAANSQIGVAKAAYFPTLNLAVTNGFQSPESNSLFTAARRYWALGPAGLALTVFDGGVKNAQYQQAIAGHDAAVAAYRQTVLTGFQEVEDQLAALRVLEQEAQSQQLALQSSEQALALTINQYQAGTVSYLNVMTAQTVALSNRQAALRLQGNRLIASVLLVKALGGGWRDSLLPTPDQADGERKWTDYLILPVGG